MSFTLVEHLLHPTNIYRELAYYVPGTLTFGYQAEIVKNTVFSKFEKSLTSTWEEEKKWEAEFLKQDTKVESKKESHISLDTSELQLKLILISAVKEGRIG